MLSSLSVWLLSGKLKNCRTYWTHAERELDQHYTTKPTVLMSRVFHENDQKICIARVMSNCDLLLVYYYRLMKSGLWKWFFLVKGFSFMNFGFKNGCLNELGDNNAKSCNWSINRVSNKLDFKAVWSRNGHADAWELKN